MPHRSLSVGVAFGLMAVTSLLAVSGSPEDSAPVLPGTQPGVGGIEFGRVDQCLMCHSQTPNGDADPFFSWQGSMMAQSARDPVFRAALAVANQNVPGVGTHCMRCHAPRGWLEGRAGAADGSGLTREDLHGVTCEVCHRLADPLSAEAATLAGQRPPALGHGMMVVDPENVVRGPYGDGTGAMPHRVKKSPHHASSELCATCHNVSTPELTADVPAASLAAFGHFDRAYTEWLLSDFPARGAEGTCQACHYPAVEGGGKASRFGSPHRDHFVVHGPVGGSTWVQDATFRAWGGKGMDPKAFDVAKRRARALLKTAATLDLSFREPDRALLRITNTTGHKLPTGFPAGRRMWVNARFIDASGTVIGEIGRYGDRSDTLGEFAVTVPTLLDPKRTRVYEALPGLSAEQADRHGKTAGPSLHLVLGDTIVKDNRIPPSGFTNEAFAKAGCAPAGVTYADGQHWDDVPLELPAGTATVEARLMYQSVSWEYIKFLAEENRTDDWGRRLYELWTQTNRCPPEVMAEVTRGIGD